MFQIMIPKCNLVEGGAIKCEISPNKCVTGIRLYT